MSAFTIKGLLDLPNPPVSVQRSNSCRNSNQESLNELLEAETGSRNTGPKEVMDTDTFQPSHVDSGIGTTSGSNIENNLDSSLQKTLPKEPPPAAISTPLNNRQPDRVSEIIQIPKPNEGEVQEFLQEGRRKKMKKFHQCIYCAKKFDRPSLLKRHTYTHTKEKPWKCQYCNKGFNTKSLVVTHERVHTGEKPFICEFCGKTFNAGSNFSFHRDIHLKKRRHQCQVCEKRFVTPGDLRKHSFTHTGDWPFRCSQCNKGFATERSLRNHIPAHSRIKPFPCEHCNRSYTTESSRKTHMRLHQTSQRKCCSVSPSQESRSNRASCRERSQSTASTSNSNNQVSSPVSQSPRASAQPTGTGLTPSNFPAPQQSPGMDLRIQTSLTSFMPAANPQVYQAPTNPLFSVDQGVCYYNLPGWSNRPSPFRTPSPRWHQSLSASQDVDPQIQNLKNQFEGLGLRVSKESAFTVVENRETRPNLPEIGMNRIWNIDPMESQALCEYRTLSWPQLSYPGPDDLPLDLSTRGRNPCN